MGDCSCQLEQNSREVGDKYIDMAFFKTEVDFIAFCDKIGASWEKEEDFIRVSENLPDGQKFQLSSNGHYRVGFFMSVEKCGAGTYQPCYTPSKGTNQ